MKIVPKFILAVTLAAASGIIPGCNKSDGSRSADNTNRLTGTVHIDGSSTVFPITEAVAEEFRTVQPDVRVTVGISGTGGGFKKFSIGETDINDASRIIKSTEIAKTVKNNIRFIELPIAYDGLSVIVNPNNNFVDYLSVAELRKIWQPDSTVKKWSDVRPEWPDNPITLYGPGMDSGTFDYFTKAINGKEQACRSDFTASEDDNVLVLGIAGDKNALGYFGYAYYAENKSRLKLVPIKADDKIVAPSITTINNGTYKPLSRPIFIYASAAAAQRKEVDEFIKFYLQNAAQLTQEVGYVPLPESTYKLVRERYENRTYGSMYTDQTPSSANLENLLKADK